MFWAACGFHTKAAPCCGKSHKPGKHHDLQIFVKKFESSLKFQTELAVLCGGDSEWPITVSGSLNCAATVDFAFAPPQNGSVLWQQLNGTWGLLSCHSLWTSSCDGGILNLNALQCPRHP